ncbi:hypothetical protein EKE94_06940 [Mesobaculum littorinae]|uniref:Uncharacterized protein n=1 Tax=Mesobaculum littorinae TaxID=2486419 RepID=A0A438AIX4_9RHOB|nr:hypothetical protein [Mesobaculum littorinae]RVV98642.1 hypothetical protein EKE94_06940 [Mesobaculum littorinae]
MTDLNLTLDASLPRRAFATALLIVLGGLLLNLAATGAPSPGWIVVLAALGVGALVLAVALWRATASSVVLTDAGLAQSDGRPIAAMSQIEAVERGMFAFKPSNGFLLRLGEGGSVAWAPGLWWRLGRRVGVGGVTGAPASRAMAEMLALHIARRDATEMSPAPEAHGPDQE